MKKSLLSLLLLFGCASKNDLVMDRESHEFHGLLQTGIVAIGGETTGVTLEASDGKTYELYMKNTGQLKKYRDKKVRILGRYTAVPGVEIPIRHVIEVTEIKLEE